MKKTISIHSVLNWPPHKRQGVCPIPGHIHHKNTPSFSIFRGKDGSERWLCFNPACPSNTNGRVRGGDVVDLIGYLTIPGYRTGDSQMRRMAVEVSYGNYATSIVPEYHERSAILTNADLMKYHPIHPNAMNYLVGRGISQEVIREFRVGGLEDVVAIPTFQQGELRAIKLRYISDRKYRYMSEKGSVKSLFGYDKVFGTDRPVFVVEGEIKALALYTHGFLACSPTSGINTNMSDFAHVLAFSPRIIVIGDNDDAGRQGAQRWAEQLNAAVFFPPEPYKDVDEWLLKDKSAKSKLEEVYYGS